MYPRFLQFGAFVISTYGVLAVVAALCAVALWTSIARRTGMDAEKMQNAGLLAVVCVVVGARLAVVVANWRGFLEAAGLRVWTEPVHLSRLSPDEVSHPVGVEAGD